ncbi:uncharacterized protein Dmul_04310 [Desulfococcus multivorans]|nr:uncharacterized protein Dmul_04310 [Desulfococcus multivorans]
MCALTGEKKSFKIALGFGDGGKKMGFVWRIAYFSLKRAAFQLEWNERGNARMPPQYPSIR